MKRMVKNGDLLDVSEDGSGVSFGGNLKVGGTIIANGEIRGGDVSASKFYLGTEEMPLVKANPAGDATGTLEKIKIGNVAYNVGGGSDYTAGSNIVITETNEISVNPELTGIEKIKFGPTNDYEITSYIDGIAIVKNATSRADLSEIQIKAANNSTFLRLMFNYDYQYYQNLYFSTTGSGGDQCYAFITRRNAVPMVPKIEGTYLLKAIVDNTGVPSYEWVKQQ